MTIKTANPVALWQEFHCPHIVISAVLKQHRHNIRAALEEIEAIKAYGGLDAPEKLPAGSTRFCSVVEQPQSRLNFRG